ncbi:hypothetical protein [Kitasatospora sp. NPDC057738]|uniref:hypothetical protein n=1 Tax=Kitasatospora sp. NPDC057738 TaxID=3346233 RepID=UPI0036C44028
MLFEVDEELIAFPSLPEGGMEQIYPARDEFAFNAGPLACDKYTRPRGATTDSTSAFLLREIDGVRPRPALHVSDQPQAPWPQLLHVPVPTATPPVDLATLRTVSHELPLLSDWMVALGQE